MSNNGDSSEMSGNNNSTNLKKIYNLEKRINVLLLNAERRKTYNAKGNVILYNETTEFRDRMDALSDPLQRIRRRRQTRNVSRATTPEPSRPSSPATRKRKNRKTRRSRR